MSIRIEITQFSTLPEAQREEIDSLYYHTFMLDSDPDYRGIRWPDALHLLVVYDQETWVNLVEINYRTIKVGGKAIFAGGVGGVLTEAEHRGKGYAKLGVRRAVEFLCDEIGVEAALLICKRKLVPYYAALGWEEVAGPLIYTQDDERRTFGENIASMVYLCSGAAWPSGEIDMCGSPW